MEEEFRIFELDTLEPWVKNELSKLLVKVVDDGASIGFMSPMERTEAEVYWHDVLQPGIMLWVVKSNNEIVATVQLHLALKPNAMHRAEVCKLMVDPSFRRKGIGKKLMERVEEKARKLGRSLLILDTRAGDPSNLLYRSVGFHEAGRIPRFAMSSNGSLDDTVIYFKELSEK